MHVRKDDTVEVISGASTGITARVLRILEEEGKVVVEGVGRVYRHLKPNRQNAQGGRLSREMPIDASNVLLYCGTCKRGVRVGYRYDKADGHKERFCKKCKNTLGTVGSKARARYSGEK